MQYYASSITKTIFCLAKTETRECETKTKNYENETSHNSTIPHHSSALWLRFYRAACNADAVLRWEFCPSVTRVLCDKTVERSVQIYIPYERTFIPLLWEEEWLVGGDPFYVKYWVNRPPLELVNSLRSHSQGRRYCRLPFSNIMLLS